LYEDLDVQPQKEGNSLQLQESLTWVENAVKFQKLMAFKKEISHGIRGKNLNLTIIWKLKSVKG
jgi:hypothetical protein